MASGDKIERKYLVHYVDANMGKSETDYVRIGKDLEEYSIEMNPDTDTVKNIWGENSTTIKGYDVSSSVDTFYAREGDALFTALAKIVNDRSTGSALETTVVDALFGADGEQVWAYRENALLIPQSLGGDNGGVQIPYQIQYVGDRVAGTFTVSTKKFEPTI